jgi:hypothetical protein
MRATLHTAGERVELVCRRRSFAAILQEGAAGELVPSPVPAGSAGHQSTPMDLRVTVEETTEPFETSGWEPLTRGAWRRPGRVIVQDACSSGLDVLASIDDDMLDMRARWRPSRAVRAADLVLRSRSRLLQREVLLQYPALWWAGRKGRAPLHASVCTLGAEGAPAVMIAGPGGVGKSTLVSTELSAGGVSTCDNMCASDGFTAWGLVEPLRVEMSSGLPRGSEGRRMPHGRRETRWPARVASLSPDALVVLRRGTGEAPVVRRVDAEQAARVLVTGTYMAGELRRYWQFASTLALGTGVGRAHAAVEAVAERLTAQLPCWEVVLGRTPGARLATILDGVVSQEVAR